MAVDAEASAPGSSGRQPAAPVGARGEPRAVEQPEAGASGREEHVQMLAEYRQAWAEDGSFLRRSARCGGRRAAARGVSGAVAPFWGPRKKRPSSVCARVQRGEQMRTQPPHRAAPAARDNGRGPTAAALTSPRAPPRLSLPPRMLTSRAAAPAPTQSRTRPPRTPRRPSPRPPPGGPAPPAAQARPQDALVAHVLHRTRRPRLPRARPVLPRLPRGAGAGARRCRQAAAPAARPVARRRAAARARQRRRLRRARPSSSCAAAGRATASADRM
jgi:hypothetical protein